ncbi:hypothetical protein ElyMa_000031200 [Elysia marginata]|uniref:Secreted protein n=1 Tax=Elysia marginata TaxID=1093978 RepID=A0AAV4EBW6_9GAST|nr:hypothetical protein ElyMa_000031200 [Elysia marginata]
MEGSFCVVIFLCLVACCQAQDKEVDNSIGPAREEVVKNQNTDTTCDTTLLASIQRLLAQAVDDLENKMDAKIQSLADKVIELQSEVSSQKVKSRD